MRLIYLYRSLNQGSGVDTKRSAQVEHLVNQGLDAITYSIYADNNQQCIDKEIKFAQVPGTEQFSGFFGKVRREYQVNRFFKDMISALNAQDIIYLRIPYPSPQLSRVLKQPRACKIVIEYQTIEPAEYRLKGKYWYVLIDTLFGTAIRRYTDAIVGVTDEITQYEFSRSGNHRKPHITIGNGFDVNSAPVRRSLAYTEDDDLHLLCVANVNRWHGLDRLLQGLAVHNSNRTAKVVFHIVGDGSELPHLQELTDCLNIADYIVFHGFLTDKALDALFDQCHIAVGSLGIHRKGLTHTSELKAREYCARGIPYITACTDPDFPEDFPYILHSPADESPVDIENILMFARVICRDPDHPQKMHHYAVEHLDWSVKMKRLKNFLEVEFEER